MIEQPTIATGPLMTRLEFLKAVRAAAKVYAWVKTMPEDGAYLQVVKEDVKSQVRGRLAFGIPVRKKDACILARVDEETGYLYIN